MACLVAYVLGFLAARAYEIAEKHKTIDNATFLVYTIALSFLVLSVIGLMGRLLFQSIHRRIVFVVV